MSQSTLFEDFTGLTVIAHREESTSETSNDALEEIRLGAFENGYQAGWDDAVKSRADGLSELSTDLEASLQQMAFGYSEARRAVLDDLKPFFDQLASKLLPAMMSEQVGDHLAACLSDLADRASGAQIQLTVAPEDRAAVDKVITAEPGSNVSVHEDPGLSSGQLRIRAGKTGAELDLPQALDRIKRAISDFYATQEKVG